MGSFAETNFNYYLNLDLNKFKEGEWVAIHSNKVIAHGMALKKVVEEAKKIAEMKKILFSKVKKTALYL